MMAAPEYWAFCVYPGHEGRTARGFVLAASKTEAKRKARARVMTERRRFAKQYGTQPVPVPGLRNTRAFYRVRVWVDPDLSTAPGNGTRCYIERGSQ
jgi:hypothetical protein